MDLNDIKRTIDLQLFGDGDTGNGGTAGAAGGNAGDGQASGAGAGTSNNTSTSQGGDGAGTNLDGDALKAELTKTRQEAAKYRTERKTLADQIAALAKAVGIEVPADKPGTPDANQVMAEVAKLRDDLRKATVRNAYLTAADKTGADKDLAWAVLQAGGDLDKLDMTGDVEAQIVQRLTALTAANPKLKAGSPGATGTVGAGSNPAGGSGNTPASFTAEQLANMTPAEINAKWADISKAMAEGRVR